MQIEIDDRIINVSDPNLNIVQIAKESGIIIPAPCFNTNREFGCCNVCAIEIDGTIHYACCTKPLDGMKVFFKRDDLDTLRRERIKQFAYNNKHNIKNDTCCSDSSCGTDCGCS
jgi:NADH dehydrogenase/NADH:ubiquinone oxidoreductase subunit G